MFIIVSTVFGALSGFNEWCHWFDHKEKIKIQYKIIEGTVNVAFNTGMLILYVGSSTIASFLVAVTAPLSVPLFIKYASV